MGKQTFSGLLVYTRSYHTPHPFCDCPREHLTKRNSYTRLMARPPLAIQQSEIHTPFTGLDAIVSGKGKEKCHYLKVLADDI